MKNLANWKQGQIVRIESQLYISSSTLQAIYSMQLWKLLYNKASSEEDILASYSSNEPTLNKNRNGGH